MECFTMVGIFNTLIQARRYGQRVVGEIHESTHINPEQTGFFADWYGRGRADSAPSVISVCSEKYTNLITLTLNRQGFLQIGMAGGGQILLPL